MSRSLVGSSSTSRLAGRASCQCEQEPVALAAGKRADRGAGLFRPEQEVAQVTDHVPGASLNRDLIAATRAQRLPGRRVQIERLTPLVDIADGEIGAEANAARIRREPTDQQTQERGLATTVRADDPDAIPAHDPGREVTDQRMLAEVLGDALGLDHQLAAGRIGCRSELDPALRRDPPCPFRAQGLKTPEPSLIAPAPGGDAVARPFGLGGDGLVHPAQTSAFFLGEDLLGPGIERGEALVEDADPAAIEPPRRAADGAKEGAVVTDQDQAALPAREILLEAFDGRQVEMVGRLVEQEHVGRSRP